MKLEERKAMHAMSVEQLQQELRQAEQTLLNYQFDAGLKRLSNPAGIHNTRKRIAMLKTLMRERALLAEHPEFTSMDEYKAWKHAEVAAYHAARKAR